MKAVITLAHYVPLLAALLCLGLAYYVYDLGADYIALLVLGFSALICITVFFVFDYPRLQYVRRVNTLKKTGVLAQASVIKAEQTSRYMNLRPQISIRLSFINPRTGQKVLGTVNDYFDIREAASLRPGATLTIRFNPDRPEEIGLA